MNVHSWYQGNHGGELPPFQMNGAAVENPAGTADAKAREIADEAEKQRQGQSIARQTIDQIKSRDLLHPR